MLQTSLYADLHLHTYYSDGFYKPSEIIKFAKECGLKAVSITDHDTVLGVEEAMQSGKELGVEVVSGIELSANMGGEEIHILGYFIDWQDSSLIEHLDKIKLQREIRTKKMVDKLDNIGVKIDFDELVTFAGKGTITRFHLANFLCKKGIVTSVYEAFKKYIGKGCPACENVNAISVEDAVDLINKFGGMAVCAHPNTYKINNLIPSLAKQGVKGVEVYHPSQSPEVVEQYINLAKEFNLFITGGSDWHGDGKQDCYIGNMKLPYHHVEKIKQYVQRNKVCA